MELYQILIISIILIVIISFIYIKLKSKFWSKMPMFFKTRPHYWLISPKLLYEKNKLPIIDKLTNKYDVKCEKFYPFDMTDNQKFSILQFIKHNYIHNSLFTNNPDLHKTLDLFFSQYYSTQSPCFIGKFITKQFSNTRYNSLIHYSKYQGLLLSKNLNVSTQKKVLQTNYFSFLSTNRKQKVVKNRNITPDLLYNTGLYVLQNSVSTGLFKTYRCIHNVYPLLTYYEYLFDIKNIYHKPYDKFFKLTKINDSNFSLIRELIENNFNNLFENTLVCDSTNLYEMIKHNNIHIFISAFNKSISSVYIYKNFGILYNNEKVYDLIGSICMLNDDLHKQLFINNLCNSIDYLKKNDDIRYLNIHNTSYNNKLLQFMKTKYRNIHTLHSYWYFINYISNPIETNKTVIIY